MQLPEMFRHTRDYKFDPVALEAGHSTLQEKDLYAAIKGAAAEKDHDLSEPAVVVDLCCATGGCAEHSVANLECASLYLVDWEPKMLDAARQKKWLCKNVFYEPYDAVSWKCPKPADFVLLNSAYHHIPDDKKVQFLKNISNYIKENGNILVGEHFLPAYDPSDETSYKSSVIKFYGERIRYLEEMDTPEDQIQVIRQTGMYCWQRKYEYQVSREIFFSHLKAAGYSVKCEKRLWPNDLLNLPDNSGSFVLVLEKP